MLDGSVHPDYADVAAALVRIIPKDNESGAAVCVYHQGSAVVDIWGGARGPQGEAWVAETTAPSFSTTKGVVSTLLHILVDKGKARYDDPVCEHWPEFAAHGKGNITIRHVLCHEAGLYRIDEMIDDPTEMLDWEHMKAVIADAKPVHQPGEHHGYHALTYGWLMGGLIEAIGGKPLETLLQEELVDPLQLDGMFIGMPHNELYRRARLTNGKINPPAKREPWQDRLLALTEAALSKLGIELAEFRSALMPFSEEFDWNDEAAVRAKIPAANGQFTARSLARMYAMLASGGTLDGVRVLSEKSVMALSSIQNNTRDKVLFLPMKWRLGYHRAFTLGASAPQAFGHYGYGGSGAFCDPQRDLAVALTVNYGAGMPTGDTRMPRIARAAIHAVDRLRG